MTAVPGGGSAAAIRVLIAEDVAMVRGALAALLDLERDIEVVAQVGSGDEVMPAIRAHGPHVAVLDIDLPGRDGLSLAHEIAESTLSVRTLMLTSLGRPGTLRRAMAANVGGFLLKDSSPDRLMDAVREVAAGRRAIDPGLAIAAWDSTPCPLTVRELEALRHAADGLGSAQIAARMFLSVGTVRNYLTAAGAKLQARTRVDAIRIAREADWL